MTDKNEIGDLRSKYDANSLYAERIAYLILVGLAVEIVGVFVLRRPWPEAALTILTTSLILIGVWGELFFERRAKEAGDRLVLSATVRALEAQLELAKLRSSRREDLRGKEADLAAKLASFSGTVFDAGIGLGDGEQADFVWDLESILTGAGWRQLNWLSTVMGPNIVTHRGNSGRCGLGNVSAQNVEIHLHPNSQATLTPAANALIFALTDVGIAARAAGYNIHNGNDAAVHIVIGPKR
jgi:hypothetical protein